MRVSAVDTIVLRIPLAKPVAFSVKRFTFRDYTVLRLHTDEGLEGHSYCIGGAFVAAIVRELAEIVIGRDPDVLPAIWEDLYGAVRSLGRRGAPMVALSALDNALWDLRGRALGLPLYRLLGAMRTEVTAYASGGAYVEGATLADLAAEYEGYAAAGVPAAKMRVGRLSVREDAKRVRTVRQALGPDIVLGVDANAAWASADEALRFLDAVSDCQVGWVEEPFHPEAFGAYRQLARLVPIPLSAGEQESGRWTFAQMIDGGAIGILQPDVTMIGGVSEWLRVADAAASFGLPVLPHYFPPMHIHLACAHASVRWVEYVPLHQLVNFDLVFTEPVVPKGGVLRPPEAPGFGLSLDWDKVAHYQIG